MIRKILFLLLMLSGLSACEKDNNTEFDIPVDFPYLRFDAIPGGAVMRYKLPDNIDIFGVRVRYTDAYGKQLFKDGSYLSDTLLLSGFTEAQTGVVARISFFNNKMEESEPIEKTFATKASAAVALFDDLKVNPFWGGFNVIYTAPEVVSGMIHIFYAGTNPITHKPDSILMGSYAITGGGDTLNFEIKQTMDFVDVIVRTDDYAGNRVKMQVYEKIPCLTLTTLTPSDFDFDFTGNIVENEKYDFGLKYLFDGKKKGDDRRKNIMEGQHYKYSTFVAGPETFSKRFIIDFRKAKIPAAIKLYAFLRFDDLYPARDPSHPFASQIWNGVYPSRLPCKVTIYGTNASNPREVALASCTNLCQFEDDPGFRTGFSKSWCSNTDCFYLGNKSIEYHKVSDKVFDAADPIVLNLLCNYTGTAYRYLIFTVEDTYENLNWGEEANPLEYVTFDELEVCVKSE